jgi:RNA polymerase sigma factor (sigma-70 family)
MNMSEAAKTEGPLTDVGLVSKAYEAWAPELRRYAMSRTHDTSTAEDLVQDAFLRLAIEARTSRSPSNPRAWLYRVVLNLIVSGSRRAEVARRRSAELSNDYLADSAEAVILASERNQALVAALQILGATSRTSLLLAAQGYTGREIAAVLGRSEAATRTMSCRARKAVRRELTSKDGAWQAA